ncbi:VOC family protein [Sphingomonas sp.]|uniref:VOC family protein n=1 Tax=Sphingomonas sp. TaxID=28214 RepID=UPI0035BC7519
MINPHGTPIWYELVTADPDASKTFYDAVIGWTIEPQPSGPMDYRMIDTGDGLVGGVMRMTPEMEAGGGKPRWLFYVGVDDVDATAETIKAKGGQVHMGPFDLEGVGRMAFAADPQGTPFYIMRGASDASSTAWHRDAAGKCNWNELATPDEQAANTFYAEVFGWTYPGGMPMGDMGEYCFVEAGGQTIGATMRAAPDSPTGWLFYFGVPDVHAAKAAVEAHGGTVRHGPSEVPGGMMTVVASDPHGVHFGVVGPNKEA